MNKGIVLAAGLGTRLYPLTKIVSKQLLPIYNYPMIYYPINLLKKANIKEILIISTEKDINKYKEILNNEELFYDISFSYVTQKYPNGIPEAFKIANECKFYTKEDTKKITLILGDNIFYGNEIIEKLKLAIKNEYSTIFLKKVLEPNRYGVLDIENKIIIEKPKIFVSNFVVTGLYVYNNNIISFVENLKPSKRNETEITDINNLYLKDKMNFITLQNTEWFDAGTFDSLLDCSNFIASIIRRNGEIFDY